MQSNKMPATTFTKIKTQTFMPVVIVLFFNLLSAMIPKIRGKTVQHPAIMPMIMNIFATVFIGKNPPKLNI
jgi:hypothetical protein